MGQLTCFQADQAQMHHERLQDEKTTYMAFVKTNSDATALFDSHGDVLMLLA